MTDHPAAQAALKAADTASLLVAMATLAKILPALAALLSCVWYAIRIYEWVARKLDRRPAPEPTGGD
jgi:thiaminase